VTQDREAAAAALVTLRRRVDDHFAAAQARSPDAMRCGPGCDRCCHVRISVFAIEADRIAARLRAIAQEDPELRERVRVQANDPALADRCALLVDGRCAVYDERPMICRSHGVPVRTEGETTCCPLNFAGTPAPASSVLELDALNRPLAVMATMHDGRGDRIALATLAVGPSRA
jgi:Fe-S-cluster containining protein